MIRAEIIFKALADPTRQRLLRVLSSHDLTVSELVEVLDQPQSTVSRHLKVLRESGLLVDRRFGNTVRYAALPPNPVLSKVGVAESKQMAEGAGLDQGTARADFGELPSMNSGPELIEGSRAATRRWFLAFHHRDPTLR